MTAAMMNLPMLPSPCTAAADQIFLSVWASPGNIISSTHWLRFGSGGYLKFRYGNSRTGPEKIFYRHSDGASNTQRSVEGINIVDDYAHHPKYRNCLQPKSCKKLSQLDSGAFSSRTHSPQSLPPECPGPFPFCRRQSDTIDILPG